MISKPVITLIGRCKRFFPNLFDLIFCAFLKKQDEKDIALFAWLVINAEPDLSSFVLRALFSINLAPTKTKLLNGKILLS